LLRLWLLRPQRNLKPIDGWHIGTLAGGILILLAGLALWQFDAQLVRYQALS
jgi:undecaprenyl-diphosphatase